MSERNIGQEMIDGMHQAVDYMRGEKNNVVEHQVKIPEHIDVRGIRQQCQLSRMKFAKTFGFSHRTLQHWEQGDRQPQGPARILLLLLQRDPNVVAAILSDESLK